MFNFDVLVSDIYLSYWFWSMFLSSPNYTLSLLSTNQSIKFEKSRFRCFSIVFISLCLKTRQVLLAYYISPLSTAWQPVACRWHKLKRAVDPKLVDTCYWCFIQICIFYTGNKLSNWKIWCVPLDCLISKI